MKILIGLPLPFDIDCPGRQSMSKVLKEKSNLEISGMVATGANIWQLRNRIAGSGSQKIYQSLNYDFYLSTDWDIRYSLKDIENLVNRKSPIVSGAYARKGNPLLIHAGSWKDEIIGLRGKYLPSNLTGIQEVDWVGGGFLLIRRDALETMEYPWFRSELIKYGDCQEATSADFGFCINAKRHKIPIHIDYDCKVEHIKI
jgi:hypothetical protein